MRIRHFVLLAAVACCLAGGACQSTDRTPRLTSITPNVVSARIATPATITGENLFASIYSPLDDRPPTQDTRWQVVIAGRILTDESVILRDAATLDIIIPAELPAGTHEVHLTSPDGVEAAVPGGVDVLDDAELLLSLENAAGGTGVAIDQRLFVVAETLEVHAVGRRAGSGEFLGNIAVDWSLNGQAMTLVTPTTEATSATLRAQDLGTVRLVANHPLYGNAQTSDLIVGLCTRNEHCPDPCSATTSCRLGVCVPGESDKDSDGDTYIDAACSGGNDCDDGDRDEFPGLIWYPDRDGDSFGDAGDLGQECERSSPTDVLDNNDCDDDPLAGCGAGCFPGNPVPDRCDGDDQDCDALFDENPEFVWYLDADNDSFGSAEDTTMACVAPMGYVGDAQDCADTPSSDPVCGGQDGSLCNPLQAEGPEGHPSCSDGADNNCNGRVDQHEPGCCPNACAGCSSGCCLDSCGAGDCMLQCTGVSCPCNLDCEQTNGKCETACSGNSTCAVDCTEVNNCEATCTGNATTCSYNCTDTNNCEVNCSNSATCAVDCRDANNCDKMRCMSGASCIVDCTGANNCSFDTCNGGQQSCPGNIIVCNRSCP